MIAKKWITHLHQKFEILVGFREFQWLLIIKIFVQIFTSWTKFSTTIWNHYQIWVVFKGFFVLLGLKDIIFKPS